MEDAALLLELGGGDFQGVLLAVLDGHGGSAASRIAAEVLPRCVEVTLPAMRKSAAMAAAGGVAQQEHIKRVEASLQQAMLDANELMRSDGGCGASGTTCVLALLTPLPKEGLPSGSSSVASGMPPPLLLTVANAGDSRAVGGSRGEAAEALSWDHDPVDAREVLRMEACGGRVDGGHVVGFGLAVSRGLGDYEQALVSAKPDMRSKVLRQGYTAVLACDGLWDVMRDHEALALAHAQPEPAVGARQLCDFAYLAESSDNITVLVLHAEPGV